MSAQQFCTVTASTMRNQSTSLTQVGEHEPYLAGLQITPFWPVNTEIVDMTGIGESPHEIKECYHVPADGSQLPDIQEGDVIVVEDKRYPVSFVAEWGDPIGHGHIASLHIIVQIPKGTSGGN